MQFITTADVVLDIDQDVFDDLVVSQMSWYGDDALSRDDAIEEVLDALVRDLEGQEFEVNEGTAWISSASTLEEV
jgi:hypothetical protein